MKTTTLPKGPSTLARIGGLIGAICAILSTRSQHISLERYVIELLTDLPHKNCEAIAQGMANTSLEQLQQLLMDAA